MEYMDRTIMTAIPCRPAALVRISEDPKDTERGVDRQAQDCHRKHGSLGWQGELRVITENDTSAYKRKRITMADGTRVLRVVRPEFEALIKAINAGEVDGLIVYDLDRLVRQPRQLEDLIDAVEAARIPVHSTTSGHVNLLTADGRAMARVMCAMALKSSEDTSRRVARAAFQAAVDGTATRGGPRRFGWEPDHMTLREPEAAAIREMVRRVTEGESVTSVCHWLNESGISTVNPARKIVAPGAGKWLRGTVCQVLRSPRIAGIRTYTGVGRGREIGANDWRNRAATKNGEYVMGPWEPVVTVDVWEMLQHVLDAPGRKNAASGAIAGGSNARKYLLTGFLRCGKCSARMNGKSGTTNRRTPYYQCLGKDQGGCGGVRRNLVAVDDLITELLMRRLEERAIVGYAPDLGADERAHIEREVDRLEGSKEAARTRWRAGKYKADVDYYADVDALDEELAELTAKLATTRRVPKRVLAQPREAWASGSVSQRRAMIAEELVAITVMPQAKLGRFGWNPAEIVPSWRA